MAEVSNMPELVIVSGMSGAGRTEAMHVFEDLGYYCVDNLPPSLIDDLVLMADLPNLGGDRKKIAIVCDARTHEFFSTLNSGPFTGRQSSEVREIINDWLEKQGIGHSILFLDAENDRLIARYKSSRRRHPLCADGATISSGIERERALMREIRANADFVIDTTSLLPAELREKIKDLYAHGDEREGLAVSVYSFGFKHGNPSDADLVIDVRFLPNPYYDPEMRTMTGLDDKVRDYVLYNSDTETFIKRWEALLDCVMPGYVSEGKQQLSIAVGCTGGQHRSVALAEVTGDYLRRCGYRVSVAHRDLALAVRPDDK